MAFQRYSRCIICLLTLLAITFLFHYASESRSNVSSSIVPEQNVTQLKKIQKHNWSRKSLLLKHIEQCPECVLFLLTKKTFSKKHVIFDVLNEIPSHSHAVFYPLRMKLYYNKPIPYYTILSNNQTKTVIRARLYWRNYFQRINNIKNNSILHFIRESLQQPVQTIDHSWPNKTKLILYYTRFFGKPYWYNNDEKSVYENDFNIDHCPVSVNACHITIDQKLFSQSDAALVHMREAFDFRKLTNMTRQPWQRLVFFLKESPINTPHLPPNRHGKIYNYTQTYRPDSDISASNSQTYYWLFDHKIYPNYNFESILKTKVDGKIAVAIISNCRDSSHRLGYISELKAYTSVDIYGQCGVTCNHVRDCHEFAFSTYKFYLAFENSLCDEYVTEKFFNVIHNARIVPIVLGWVRYDQYVPRSAYIDIRDFKTPRHLADYITYLDKNTTAYLEYFRWKQYALHIKVPQYMCELCLKLFLDDRDHKQQSLENVDIYWNRKTQCHNFTRDSNGTWLMQ